jgi:hypothetical protein
VELNSECKDPILTVSKANRPGSFLATIVKLSKTLKGKAAAKRKAKREEEMAKQISSKTECGHLNGGKSKAVTYAFPPGYRENAEEEEEAKQMALLDEAIQKVQQHKEKTVGYMKDYDTVQEKMEQAAAASRADGATRIGGPRASQELLPRSLAFNRRLAAFHLLQAGLFARQAEKLKKIVDFRGEYGFLHLHLLLISYLTPAPPPPPPIHPHAYINTFLVYIHSS